MKKMIFAFAGTLTLALSMSSAWATEVIRPSTCQITDLELYHIGSTELIASVKEALIAKGYDLTLLDQRIRDGWSYASIGSNSGLQIHAGEQFFEGQAQHGGSRRHERRARRYERRSHGSNKVLYIFGPSVERSEEGYQIVPTVFTAYGRERRFQRTSLRHQSKVANWVIDQLPECQASSL